MENNKTFEVSISVDELDIQINVVGFKSVEAVKLHSPSIVKHELVKNNSSNGKFIADIVISDSNGDYVDSDTAIVKFEDGNVNFVSE